VVILGFLGSALLSFGVFLLLERILALTLTGFTLVWILIACSAISTAVVYALNSLFLSPINRLGQAMQDVAGGNFDLQLETQSRIPDVQAIYASFNSMTRELRKTELLQEDFVSNVSHEFKTPINAIEGYAMLLQDTPQSDEQREYVERILRSTQRLSDLTGNILLLSRVENQAVSRRGTPYRLDEQVRQSIMLLEPRWMEKEIEFDVDLDAVSYDGNEGLMFQVWNNLIGNAIKFNVQGGLVRMRMSQQENIICFTIEDEGPGIPPEAQAHIFDKFYQCDSSHRGEGNGLGLALVKRIVDLCGGRVTMENRRPMGACFTVLLPLEDQQSLSKN